jgi:hypothetical protein
VQREELLGCYFDEERTLLQRADPVCSAADIMRRAREALYSNDFVPPTALLAKINDLTSSKRPTPSPLKGEVSLPSHPHRELIPCTSEFPGKVVGKWEGWQQGEEPGKPTSNRQQKDYQTDIKTPDKYKSRAVPGL